MRLVTSGVVKVELLNVKQPSRMNINSNNVRALLSNSESVSLHGISLGLGLRNVRSTND